MIQDFKEQFDCYLSQINAALPHYLPKKDCPQGEVIEAMEYSLLGSGKRIRAILTLVFCELCGGKAVDALPFAASVEMIHAYSLVHDDLPCMDDDDLRRGKPSCHTKYGESTALLAGDALLTLAFDTLLNKNHTGNIPSDRIILASRELSYAAGAEGMVGGQVIDLASEGTVITPELLATLDSLKTGALIRAAAVMGCIVAGAPSEIADRARTYAGHIGLAFQIVDDILDVTADQEELGKPIGSDKELEKSTYVSLYGLEQSREMVRDLVLKADLAIKGTELDHPFLYELADMLADRKY